jgi:hypothetical protein
VPHKRNSKSRRKRWRDWISYLDFLRRRAFTTAYFDKELREHIYTPDTTYYPGAEAGEVLADTRGRGTFQRRP